MLNRLLPALLALAAICAAASAQDLPAVGTAPTLDVATWNIERFGNGSASADEAQLANALAVFRAAEVDLWGLQEVNDTGLWDRLVDSLGTEWGAERVVGSSGLGYGFLYRRAVIGRLAASTILDDASYEFAGRPPLLLRARVTLPDTAIAEVRFVNLHAKCCGGQEDYDRRAGGAARLKDYLDNFLPLGTPFVVLGDFNDELRSSIASGRPSPYAPFVQDEDDYLFASYTLDLAGANTYCSNGTCTSGSTLDHVLLAGAAVDAYEPASADRYDAVLDAIPGYVNNTSDHLPVYARLRFRQPVAAEGAAAPAAFGLSAPFPNPFRDAATLAFRLEQAGPARLEVFDALGRRVAVLVNAALPAGPHAATFEAGALPPGLYLARLSAEGRTQTRRLVHVL